MLSIGIKPTPGNISGAVGGKPYLAGELTTHSNTDGTQPHWANIPDALQGLHSYGVDWEPDRVTWYFDGQAVQSSATPADMNKPMYMVLSTQTGTSSSWAGAPNTGQTSSMDVNYVRVYSSNPNAAFVSTTPTTTAPNTGSPAGISTLDLLLSEDAWQGDAQFSVAIDGKAIGGAQAVTTQHSTGNSQRFSFGQALSAGTHT